MSVTLNPPPPPPPPVEPVPEGWQGILDPGEKILWQGRPDTRVVFSLDQIPEILFGVFFAGFALFWIVMATWGAGFMGLFGMPFLAVGLMIIFKSNYLASERRRYTYYTLTARRAIIATAYPYSARKLKSYKISGNSPLEFEDLGDLGTIIFDRSVTRGRNTGTVTTEVSFERIADARHVWSLMRQIQQEAK